MPDQNKNYIKKINLNYKDGESIAEFISYERQAAIHDLINENSFSINEDDIDGPYVIEIEISDNVLIVKITNDNQSYSKDHSCLLYTSPSPRDLSTSRMPSSA